MNVKTQKVSRKIKYCNFFAQPLKVFQKCCTTSSLFVEFIIAVELMVSEICITFKFFSNYNDYYFY